METFYIVWNSKIKGDALDSGTEDTISSEKDSPVAYNIDSGSLGVLDSDDFLKLEDDVSAPYPEGIRAKYYQFRETRCTVKQKLFDAIDAKFASPGRNQPLIEAGHFQPPEITTSLKRLRQRFPGPKPLVFLIMRFAAATPFERLVAVIKGKGEQLGVDIIRADDNEFHADLWGNVRTLLHACRFGIAIYERIQSNEPNANVGLEVGYLMAMNKPVLLLKDKTLDTLQTDLAGKLYKPFDPHNPEGTVPKQLESWLKNNGIVL